MELNEVKEQNTFFKTLADLYFHCDLWHAHRVGEGFYGVVYRLELSKAPHQVIVKCYQQPGNHKKERAQLALLRPHSLLKVPEVYAVHDKDDDFPFDALIMEFVEGINASLLPTDHPNRERFAEEMVANLLHLHGVSNPLGFGEEGRLFSTWKDCYVERIEALKRKLQGRLSPVVSPHVRSVADRSVARFDQIFSQPVERSSLIHSDYNLWNILVDPKTARITAVIDPLNAGWADRELDLFHLQNADGDRFGLLERYQRQWRLSELFPVKNAFYWFWDDVKHLCNMGWYEEAHFVRRADSLLEQMERHL